MTNYKILVPIFLVIFVGSYLILSGRNQDQPPAQESQLETTQPQAGDRTEPSPGQETNDQETNEPAVNNEDQTAVESPANPGTLPQEPTQIDPEPAVNNEDQTAVESPANPGTLPQEPTQIDPEPASPLGLYVDYSPGNFVQYQDRERWLYYHADWCPQCQQLDADIEANLSQIPDGVVIFKVDYDSHQDLRQRYQVTLQTTVVKVGANGEKINNFGAYRSPDLMSVINGLE